MNPQTLELTLQEELQELKQWADENKESQFQGLIEGLTPEGFAEAGGMHDGAVGANANDVAGSAASPWSGMSLTTTLYIDDQNYIRPQPGMPGPTDPTPTPEKLLQLVMVDPAVRAAVANAVQRYVRT